MTTEIKNWLEKEYASAGIKNLQIDAVMGAIKEALKEIEDKELFDQRLNVSKNISVLMYKESKSVEVHISIDGVLSTYELFEQKIREMKTFVVPFQAEEIVWNGCIARVEAESKEDAFMKVEQSIRENNPFADFNADRNGINTVTSEVIETTKYGIGDEYCCTLEDVKKANEIETTITCTAFDLLRWGKDGFYEMVEQNLNVVEVLDMDVFPIGVSGDNVTYKCVPTKYTIEFFIKVFFFDNDEDPTTPFEEEVYTVYAQTEEDALKKAKDRAYQSENANGNISVDVEKE